MIEELQSLVAAGKLAAARAHLAEYELRHLNAHVDAHCLCASCLERTGHKLEHEGERFTLDVVAAGGRALFYWLPDSVVDDRERVRARMTQSLARQLRRPRRNPRRRLSLNEWLLKRG